MQEQKPVDLDDEAAALVQVKVRQRVLTLMVSRGHLTSDAALDMWHWRHGGGFSVNADVRIEAADRNGLERLLRYSTLSPDSFYLPLPCGRVYVRHLPVNG
jgi:hypothetical protein